VGIYSYPSVFGKYLGGRVPHDLPSTIWTGGKDRRHRDHPYLVRNRGKREEKDEGEGRCAIGYSVRGWGGGACMGFHGGKKKEGKRGERISRMLIRRPSVPLLRGKGGGKGRFWIAKDQKGKRKRFAFRNTEGRSGGEGK